MKEFSPSRFTSRRALAVLCLLGLGVVSSACWIARGSRPPGGAREELTWVEVTPHAGWAPGYSFSAVVLNDTLWVLGQQDGNWCSTDGRTWTRAPSNVDFTGGYNTFVVFEDEIYAIGGADDRSKIDSKAVWKSSDGLHWVLLTDHPAWSARVWHTCVVSGDRIWLLGGYDGNYRSDVWSSPDGVEWRLSTEEAPWRGRCMHASVVFDDKIWILGGRRDIDSWWETDFNDVWCSSDGNQWTRAATSAGWSKRYGLGSAAWDGKLWVMGGSRFSANNEVWFSSDGAHWTKLGNASWSSRFSGASAVFRDGVWVIGGKEGGGKFRNDVWRLARSG